MDMASSSTTRQSITQPENAFDELAPLSVPKSTEPWDIFINHRGCDVKHTFATKIYHKLHSMGLHVFLDKDALEDGDSIPAEIQHAITTAKFNIAIFSPNYAQSPWCLAELSFMLKTGAKIFPIFYRVDPSDLRWVEQGKGKYAEAFLEHENKGRYTPEKLGEWKKALTDSSLRSGHLVSNIEDEATALKNIVNRALKTLKNVPLWVAKHPIGLDELVKGFESVAGGEKVKITGIVGMGGSGKTTLAKELYNRNFSSFERCSFVSDVRDAASRNALVDKQKKLLADCGLHDPHFDNVDEGKGVLANRLSSHRALIVLDDVDHIDHLNALLPNKDNLGSQSMVIVTTRALDVLTSWDLSCIYIMPRLDEPHDKQLFCWHAFLQPSPLAEFETLVQKFLKACNGLPLSLKVLGAQLYGRKSKAYWESQLNKILRILPGEIQQRLRVSYDALDKEEREMFLDVACFLIGEKKNTAIALWDGSGWSGVHGLETLVNKCLVELVEATWYSGGPIEEWEMTIRMHDHLRDMGRVIASSHSSYRLWCPEKIDDMKHSTKRKPIRGIQPADAFMAFKEYTRRLMGNSSRRTKRLRFSNELQILSVKGNDFTEEFASLSEDLVWLRWEDFPLRNLPSWLTLQHLSVLELHKADQLEELWQDNADSPSQLRQLILMGCKKLQRFPSSIGRLQYLKRLAVYNFYGSSLLEEFCGLQSLEHLRLSSPVLSSLPVGFGNLISLRKINLYYCGQLSMLPDSFSQLIHLEVLDLSCCQMLSSLPVGFGNLKSLQKINLYFCGQLSMLPDSFSQLIHLKLLNLSNCKMLSSLPAGFGNLISLRDINLSYCIQLRTLPDSFKQLVHLEYLNLSDCAKLELRLDMLENIRKLKVLNLSNCEELEELPNQIMNRASLTELELKGCIKLRGVLTNSGKLGKLELLTVETLMWKSFQTSPVNLSFLKRIEIISSESKTASRVGTVASPKTLKEADIEDCKELSRISIPNDHLPNLESFEVEMNHLLMEIETLPVSLKILRISSCSSLKNIRCITGLINLEGLQIVDCLQIEELPSFADLASLKWFTMADCPKVEKIEGLERAKSLKELTVMTCWKVPGIQSLENVERLEEVELECESISAVKPCILSLKEYPEVMWIQGSVIRLVEPIINSTEFPDLAVTEVKEPCDVFEIPRAEDSDAFLCYIENEERKVVRICYGIHGWDYLTFFTREDFTGNKRRVAWGKRRRVAEAFYRLLEVLE